MIPVAYCRMNLSKHNIDQKHSKMNRFSKITFAVIALVLMSTSVMAQLPSSERPFVNPIPIPQSFQTAIENGTRGADGLPGPNYWQQFAEYDIKTQLFPDDNRIDGVVTIEYFNNSPDTLRSLHLDLDLNLHKAGAIRIEPAEVTEAVTIRGLKVGSEELQSRFSPGPRYIIQGTRMVAIPSQPVVPGASVNIDVDFSLEIPQAGAGGRMGYDSGNLFFLAYWYPRMAVYDDIIGWHPDLFKSQAEFYHNFGNYTIEITAPANWVVMSTGKFMNPAEVLSPHILDRYNHAMKVDATVNIITKDDFGFAATKGGEGDLLTWKFYAENVRDIAFSATKASFWDGGRASVGDSNGDGKEDFIRINAFWRSDAPFWSESVAYSQHSISFMSKYTGFAYPWPHMTAVEGANIIGGGMEFPMMTIIGDYNRAGANALYSVTLHEIAHMWIPMIISTDERRYSWIDEGYTVFHTNEGKHEYLPDFDHTEQNRQGYVRFALGGQEGEMMRWSDHHYSGGAFRIASYTKPATILAALRGVLGEETFEKVHKELFQAWSFKLMSPYDWFSIVETVSGKDLSWFWRTWYFETWTLDQAVESVTESRRSTEIVIRDNGDAPMPVNLTITLRNGDEIKHSEPVNTWLSGSRTLRITVPHRDIVRVEIDAERHFPDTNRSNNMWEK